MFAAVAGLRTHQSRMDVIGNNIANVNTFGFKKARATFRDQFYATMSGASEAGAVFGGTNPSQVGFGTLLSSVDVNMGTGSAQPTGFGMDAMILGNGFFIVGTYNAQGVDRVGNSPNANLTQLSLTRVGIFNVDGRGNLVDSMGNYVYGFMQNSPLRGPAPDAGADTRPEFVDRLEMLHVPQILMRANGDPVLDDEGNFVVIPHQVTGTGSDIIYTTDDNGNRILVGVAAGSDPAEPGSFSLTGTGAADVLSGHTFTPALTGDFFVAPMRLNNISIGNNGSVRGTNDIGQIVTIGSIAVANVPNPNGLTNVGNGYFRAEANTGVLTGQIPGEGSTGVLNAGFLEMANVDLAQEFTDMITTQRGFQANGRIITVTDEMLAELVNLKR